MLTTIQDGKTLKEDIGVILKACGMKAFNGNDYKFICEMIGDPEDVEQTVSNAMLSFVHDFSFQNVYLFMIFLSCI